MLANYTKLKSPQQRGMIERTIRFRVIDPPPKIDPGIK